jgi:uncharacterized protein (TIRG00374 family)
MSGAKEKKTKLLFVLFRICFVTTGVILAIIWASQQQRWRKLAEINPAIFACSLGIFVVAQIIIGLRWWLLLRSRSIFIPFFLAVRLHFLGLFYNNCMPGSVGGDLIRAWYITKHTDKRFEAALCVFVDRAVGLLSTLIIAVFFYALFLRGQTLAIRARQDVSFLSFVAEHKMIFIWLFGFIALILGGLSWHEKSRAMLIKICLFIGDRALRTTQKFKKAIFLYCRKPLTLLTVFGLTVFLQLMTITGFWLVGRSLGITASIKYYYVFFTLTWVLGAVPVSIGGAVVVEGMLMVLFIRFAGVAEDSALALALSQRFVWLLASLPGAVIHLIGAHLPKDFFIDYDRPVN